MPMRLALIAPPTATVPPSSLGGLEHVRWLAEALAERGHEVTLIGADLGGLDPSRYAVIDTDPTGGERAAPELVDRLHAEQAGKVLERLRRVDVVGDHTRTGWLPANGGGPPMTVQTSYQPLAGPWASANLPPAHVGLVAVSHHQRRDGFGLPWLEMIYPAIPIGEHPLSDAHDGPCVYLGALLPGSGARAALDAAHQADRAIVLVGSRPGGEATAYAEVELRPRLRGEDQLLGHVSLAERWELFAEACCLLALLPHDTPYSVEIVEAMACGAPVITMNDTVGAELVHHGVSGIVLPDLDLLAGAVERAGRLDATLIRAQAADRFDLPLMVEAYERLFSRLLGSRATADGR